MSGMMAPLRDRKARKSEYVPSERISVNEAAQRLVDELNEYVLRWEDFGHSECSPEYDDPKPIEAIPPDSHPIHQCMVHLEWAAGDYQTKWRLDDDGRFIWCSLLRASREGMRSAGLWANVLAGWILLHYGDREVDPDIVSAEVARLSELDVMERIEMRLFMIERSLGVESIQDGTTSDFRYRVGRNKVTGLNTRSYKAEFCGVRNGSRSVELHDEHLTALWCAVEERMHIPDEHTDGALSYLLCTLMEDTNILSDPRGLVCTSCWTPKKHGCKCDKGG